MGFLVLDTSSRNRQNSKSHSKATVPFKVYIISQRLYRKSYGCRPGQLASANERCIVLNVFDLKGALALGWVLTATQRKTVACAPNQSNWLRQDCFQASF